MPTYRSVAAADRKPSKIVVLPPSAFADDWKEKPADEVAVGLRFVSGEDYDMAANAALERAEAWATNGGRRDDAHFVKVYNDQLIYGIVCRAATDPNDISEPWFQKPVEDTVRQALTEQGARRLWDELNLLHVGSGVAMPVAGDSEVKRLAAILARGTAMSASTAAQQIEARKFVAYLLEQLGPHDPKATAEDADPDADEDEPKAGEEDGVYSVVTAN
jgi:hypothetical protein